MKQRLSPLPLGTLRPTGWLRDQLRIQADGLSGHLDAFWPDVARSRWIGGDAEGWERGPYWLDGVVPLAILLDDDRLKQKVARWFDYILTHQSDDGWLGPRDDMHGGVGEKTLDPWPQFVLFKAMIPWFEATGDERIVPAMTRALRRIATLLAEKPLASWAAMRWPDLVLSIRWLHARTGEPWLLDLARTAEAQGYDWTAHFADFRFTEKQPKWELENHVVNHAMALKAPAVRESPSFEDAHGWIATLDHYHGQATGVFSGDESLAGRNPSQGTELCAVVEYLFSLETLLQSFPDVALADRLERIAFNALPATFKPDMWAHQYDQQANQVVCTLAPDGDRIYTNNSADANRFGLEPCFGCCTANLHQGWPKFAAHLWMRDATDPNALTALAYAPCTFTTETARVSVRTAYPFRSEIAIDVDTQTPTTLRLRVPHFAEGATLQTPGQVRTVEPGAFHTLTVSRPTTIRLHLPMPVTVRNGFHDAISIVRGPLVYGLKIGEEWRQVKGEAPHADWDVHPTTPWNVALAVDPAWPGAALRWTEKPVGPVPFSPDGAPNEATVAARRLPEWTIEQNAAGPLPQSPVRSDEPLETVTLIPYGCTNLRVTEFPWLAPEPKPEADDVPAA